MDFLTQLRSLGLSEIEAKTYLHMLGNEATTAAEIAVLVNASRTQAYFIINNLINKNLCVEHRGKVKKYSATDPRVVMEELKKGFEEKSQMAEKLAEELQEIYQLPEKNSSPLNFIKVLYTKTSIINSIEDLEKNSRHSVLAFNKPPYLMNTDKDTINVISEEFREAQKIGINKGAEFRSIYEIENDDPENFINKMKYFEKMGEKVRVIQSLPFKLMVFDNEKVTLALKDNFSRKLCFVTILIDHKDFAVAQKEIFEIYWNKAILLSDFTKTKK